MSAKDKLVKDLKAAKAPEIMIRRASQGYYDDFDSPLAMPMTQLFEDARALALDDIAENVKQGKYDA